jgi:hypothetical protein
MTEQEREALQEDYFGQDVMRLSEQIIQQSARAYFKYAAPTEANANGLCDRIFTALGEAEARAGEGGQ